MEGVMMAMGSCNNNINMNMNMCSLSLKSHSLIPPNYYYYHHIHTLTHSNRNSKAIVVDCKLSVSSPTQTQCLVLSSSSSSHAQAEVDDHELLIQESTNGYTLAAETQAQTVRVQFQLHRECSFGQNFLLTGDHPILGSWDPNNAISLTWSEGHIWTADVDIPVGQCIRFKLLMQESDGIFVWQPGPDRVLECFQTEKMITLCEDWENPDSRIVIETDPTTNQEIQFVEPSHVKPSQEPQAYAICMEEELVSDEVVPVLVPGLSQLAVHEGPADEPEPVPGLSQLAVCEGPADEPEPVNGTAVDMGHMAQDLTLPELESKDDTANISDLNPRPEISSVNENQEMQVSEEQEQEQDHEATRPIRSLLRNDVQWSSNVMQKFLNVFGIQ